MSGQLAIRYHKWNKSDYQGLSQSILQHLGMKSLQFYMPIFSLYFYIHNTPNSQKTIDFERKYYIHRLLEITKQRYYNSNILGRALIYDSGKNTSEIKDVFCKTIPILDPMHCLHNNYNLRGHHNHHLPSGYNYNTFHKINNLDNGAYIDVFCSYIFGQLTHLKKSPSFPIFYGSVNGLGEYKYDITEEYHDLRINKGFNENLGKGFKMDMYVSDDESDESNSRSGSNSSYSDEDYDDDCIAILKKVPLQLLFLEKLEGTLEDFLQSSEYSDETLLSCMYQVAFALSYLQRRYQFTHNDLHINNVMYQSTTSKYLYYKINNQYFRVPTYGKIFKIIDFGRAIFTFKGKTYLNDVFSREGEAGGQYAYPHQVAFLKRDEKIKIQPNYHFDLCRLAMTILDEIQSDQTSQEILGFLKHLCKRRDNGSFCDMRDDFSLYISIAKNACHSLPRDTVEHSIFRKYRIKKKLFPSKSFYTL